MNEKGLKRKAYVRHGQDASEPWPGPSTGGILLLRDDGNDHVGPQWPRPSHVERVLPLVRYARGQFRSLGGAVTYAARDRALSFLNSVGAKDSIFPSVFPDDEDDGGVVFLWLAGGEKLQVEIGAVGPLFVRHVAPSGIAHVSDDLGRLAAAKYVSEVLKRMSARTRRENPNWRRLFFR